MNPAPAAPPDRRFLPAAALFVLVAAVFLLAVTHGFIPYDDPVYVTQNPHVTAGLSWAGVRWAFTTTAASNWHPLTWLSHMADCSLYGLNPAGHHLTSVLLHALNTTLLFLALLQMTAAPWRCFAVAALFGLHPLHVESVAWVAERKDVLSSTFWMLVLLAYAVRANRLRTGRLGARRWYFLSLVFFALGLMAKPMLVTLPCVLLLLDVWPLGRWPSATRAQRWLLLAEKLPFFALAAASSAITFYAQRHGGTVASMQDFPLSVRVSTAFLAYAGYLGKCFYPARLCIFYPNFAQQPPLATVALAVTLLVALTALALAFLRRRPWLAVGWFWYVGTLVPVIGFVQIGGQTMADRYTYLPLVGIFIVLVWSAGDLLAAWPLRRPAAVAAAAAGIIGLAALAAHQLNYWRSAVRLFRHAAAVTHDNWIAHYNLHLALAQTDPAAAQAELQETLRILATFAEIYDRRGVALAQMPGQEAEAIKDFRTAIRIIPTQPGPHYHLALLLARSPGSVPEAIGELETAVRLQPRFAAAHFQLAVLLSRLPGRVDECIAEFQAVLALDPNSYQAHFDLGLVLARIPWRSGEALMHFEEAQRLKPDFQPAAEMAEKMRAP